MKEKDFKRRSSMPPWQDLAAGCKPEFDPESIDRALLVFIRAQGLAITWHMLEDFACHLPRLACRRTAMPIARKNVWLWFHLDRRILDSVNRLLLDGTLRIRPLDAASYWFNGTYMRMPIAGWRARPRKPRWLPSQLRLTEIGTKRYRALRRELARQSKGK